MSAQTIILDWEGPSSMNADDGLPDVRPPAKPGVYLWTLPSERGELIAYVGEASDMEARFCEHVRCTLGGEYELYDADRLRAGAKVEKAITEYKPSKGDLSSFMDEFLPALERMTELAIDNLRSYHFYFAEIADLDRRGRELVESWLIDRAKSAEDPVQNTRVSHILDPDHTPDIRMSFEGAIPRALHTDPDHTT